MSFIFFIKVLRLIKLFLDRMEKPLRMSIQQLNFTSPNLIGPCRFIIGTNPTRLDQNGFFKLTNPTVDHSGF